MAVLTSPVERGPHSGNSTFGVLEKHSHTETTFKMNGLLIKGENSNTSYCIVLMFKSAKMRWQVKEVLVSEALGIYFSWIMMVSTKLMIQTMDECLIINKLGMTTLQC